MTEIFFSVDIDGESTRPEDHFCSGEPEADAALCEQILRRLDRGDVWAWCCVIVRATVEIDGETFSGSDSLGGCSYSNEAAFRKSGYFDDMVQAAIEDLERSLVAASKRGKAARKLLKYVQSL